MRTLFVLIAWLSSGIVYGQSYGVTKVYSDVFSNQGQDIEYDEVNDQTYIITSKICDSVECSELILFSSDDSLLSQRTVSNLDVATNTLKQRGKYLYTFGNTVPGSQTWSVNQNDLATGELDASVVLPGKVGLSRLWLESSRLVGDNFMLIGDTKIEGGVIGMLNKTESILLITY
jgi:hypothetical protein